MNKPDRLIFIAVWNFLKVLGPVIGMAALAVFAFPPVIGSRSTGGIFGLIVAEFVLLVYVIIAMAGGIGLLKGDRLGRILSIVHSALNAFVFLSGLISIFVMDIRYACFEVSVLFMIGVCVIEILIIVYLGKPETRKYFEPGTMTQSTLQSEG